MISIISQSRKLLALSYLRQVSFHNQPSDIDPMLKSRGNLPIITMPAVYKKSFKKIKRSIGFEESIAKKSLIKRNKQQLKN